MAVRLCGVELTARPEPLGSGYLHPALRVRTDRPGREDNSVHLDRWDMAGKQALKESVQSGMVDKPASFQGRLVVALEVLASGSAGRPILGLMAAEGLEWVPGVAEGLE